MTPWIARLVVDSTAPPGNTSPLECVAGVDGGGAESAWIGICFDGASMEPESEGVGGLEKQYGAASAIDRTRFS